MAAALAAGAQADKERPFHRPVMTPESNRVSSWVEKSAWIGKVQHLLTVLKSGGHTTELSVTDARRRPR